jgi:anaerobic selenocysteine-containing dehydrogenase
MNKVVHAACPHDCPDACGVLITVQDGRATKVQGDPAHPVTRGFLCAKVAKYLDRVYSPQRVLYPMKRVAAKGATAGGQGIKESSRGKKGEFEGFVRITWDEALDEITARFRQISERFGPEAILPYSYGGTLGTLGNASMDRRFFHRLGASRLDRTICAEAGGDGLKSVLGFKYGTEPEQFAESRYIIAWGANIHGNNIHLWPFIEEARRKGAKLVVIDPYRTRTAKCADWYLPINPGTDVALAMAMMQVIISEHLYDESYVLQYTFGFEQLRERVREYTPEKVAQWTGISAGDIRKLAREYATTRPAVIRPNYGLQRCDNGGMAMRAITMLPCLTGSWKEVGGGLQLSTSGAFHLDKEALERPDLMMKSPLARTARMVNMTELGKALLTLSGPPVKALFVYNSNPAAIAPDHNAVVRGLARPDLFTVVHEQFLTDTCDYADLVLPATTFFEQQELVPAYGHYYLQMSQQAIDPLGECKSNTEMFRILAQRMGFEEECFFDSEEKMMDEALASGHEFLAGIDRVRLEREPQVRLNFAGVGRESRRDEEKQIPRFARDDKSVGDDKSGQQAAREAFLPFAKGGFGTPSGKAEFYSESLAALGLDPVLCFKLPVESRHADSRNYPLEMLPRKADNYVNSTFANLESHQELERVRSERSAGQPAADGSAAGSDAADQLTTDVLEMNVADAKVREIRNGDPVRVFNDRGEIRLRALVNGSVQPGVVAARLTWAKLSAGGRNVNVLTSDRLTDMGRAPTFYSVLVEVERSASAE